MTALVDKSVLIDHLRGVTAATSLLERERSAAPLNASEITRLEILAGMRPDEEESTRRVFAAIRWHPVSTEIAELAGELGRQWLPSHHKIDAADLAIAATALQLRAQLFTRNVRHFPMFPGLTSPY